MTRRIRIGIDTGGTFTDVVAFDEDTGELVTTKTPSTPGNPADGFLAGIDKVLDLLGATGADIDAVSHGTTVATNQLLEGKVDRLGFVTNTGYEAMLEIARQSVPDGYGNSYFWVKPDRIVPRDLVKGVEGRLDVTGAEVRPFDEDGARVVARWFRDQGVDTLGVCFLHSYANPDHEERMRAVLREEHPDAVVSLSSEVLREYREYERAMTTLVDAAVKPRLSAYVTNIKERLTAYDDREIPFYVMKSNGGVLSADEVVHQPITTVLSGPAAGALGAALIAKVAGFDRVLTSDGGGTSTDVSVVIDGEPTLTTEGSVGAFPSKIPMIDVVTVGAGGGSIAWLSPEGTLKVGPQSAGADPGPLCYGKGGTEVTITDAHVVLGRIPPHLLGGEIPLDRRRRPGGRRRAGLQAGALVGGLCHRHPRDLGLEPGQRAAPGHRQARARRPRLHADHLRRLRVAAAVPADGRARHPDGAGAAQPGQRVRVRAADRRREERLRADPRRPGRHPRPGHRRDDVRRPDRPRRRRAVRRGLRPRAAPVRPHRRPALLRPGLRGPGPGAADGAVDAALLDEVAARFHAEHRALYGYDFTGDATQQVEWVNLRVSGIGPIQRPGDQAAFRVVDGALLGNRLESHRHGVCFDADEGTSTRRSSQRTDLRAGHGASSGPVIIEEFGSTVPVHPGFQVRVDEFLNLIVTREDA